MIEPQNLRITPALVALLTEIDEFKGRWKAVSWLSPDFLSKLQYSATIESVGSSIRIEGSRLMDHEVKTVLQNIGTQSFKTRDEQEVAGYAKAMAMAFDTADILPATENHVLQLHSILLTFSEKDERHRGEYKKLDNHVAVFDTEGNQIGIVFETTTPFDTPAEMQRLTAWLMLRETQRDLHPLLVIRIYIVTFLKIHPFQDGNGHLSRVLTLSYFCGQVITTRPISHSNPLSSRIRMVTTAPCAPPSKASEKATKPGRLGLSFSSPL